MKKWMYRDPAPENVASLLQQPALIASLLWQRGIQTPDEASVFLDPQFDTHLHHPSVFSHGKQAVERIFFALEHHEHITVHGDYDADGVTGSTLLLTVLKDLKAQLASKSTIDFYIPHRDKEGYGLQMATVPILKQRGTRLIITVDCGITCVNEIALAKQEGMDVIVVDHHQFNETLPDALLIHPGVPGETYPFKHLAAVGVSFKCALLLIEEARKRGLDFAPGYEKWLLDLVAIATVTDMVPLHGENRVLETYGLRVLNKTKRPGLLALIEAAGLSLGQITSESIGFAIGPRINAAGRMDHAEIALKLLLSESTDEAKLYARELERCNRLRQETTRTMMEEADKLVDTSTSLIFLFAEHWSPALVGLVAGRYLEAHGKPVVALGKHGEQWIGSGRAPDGFDVTKAVQQAGEGLLTRAGGHAQACGFALNDDRHVGLFREKLIAHAQEQLKDKDLRATLMIDGIIRLSDVTIEMQEKISALEPFGMGNAVPVFVVKDCVVVNSDVIGSKGDVLRCQLQDATGTTRKGIAFKLGFRVTEIPPGTRVDVAFQQVVNEWNGRKTAELRILDFIVCTSS